MLPPQSVKSFCGSPSSLMKEEDIQKNDGRNARGTLKGGGNELDRGVDQQFHKAVMNR